MRPPNTCVHHMLGHTGPVGVVRFSEGGTYAFSGGVDKTIKLWNPFRAKLVYSFADGHNSEVLDVAPCAIITYFHSLFFHLLKIEIHKTLNLHQQALINRFLFGIYKLHE